MRARPFFIPAFLSILLLAFGSTFWAIGAGPALAAPAGLTPDRVETLPNGLQVILVREPKAPVVTFQVWYHVGSRNETTGKTGLSHLMEHMMFKGTANHGKGEFSRIVAKNGGTENAFTGRDYTAYFENFASDRVGLSIELESDRMANLAIDPAEFKLERDVVKEERRLRTEDDPVSFLIEQAYAVAFLAHPYKSPVIGWMSDLDALTTEDIQAYYRVHYAPSQATLIVVGDIAPDRLLAQIREAFGKLPKGPQLPPVPTVEPVQEGERRIIVKREAQLPTVFVVYKTPHHASPDAIPLDLLGILLGGGKSSRLYQGLVAGRQVALDASADFDPLTADPDLFSVYAQVRQDHTPAETERAIGEEIERLQRDLVSERELQKAKNQIASGFLFGLDSNFNRAMQIGIAETVGAGAGYLQTYVDRILRVTPEDIQRVARTYLIPDRRTVGTLLPLKTGAASPAAGH